MLNPQRFCEPPAKLGLQLLGGGFVTNTCKNANFCMSTGPTFHVNTDSARRLPQLQFDNSNPELHS